MRATESLRNIFVCNALILDMSIFLCSMLMTTFLMTFMLLKVINVLTYVCFSVSLCGFGIVLIGVLTTFRINTQIILSSLTDESEEIEKEGGRVDRFVRWVFFISLFLMIFGTIINV